MTDRRLILVRIVKLMTLAAVILVSIPFISQFNREGSTSGDIRAAWEVEADLSELEPGKFLNIEGWPGGPVSVYRRTDYEIQALRQTNPGLHDPDSHASLQPDGAANPLRSLQAGYFVFIPRETRRQCRVRYIPANKQPKPDIDWYGGFSEPCLGSLYDTAGRIYAAHRHEGQQNLTVPPHQLLDDDRIQLAPWER